MSVLMSAVSFKHLLSGSPNNMRYLLLLAVISVAFAADAEKAAQPELNPEESASPIRVHEHEHQRFDDGLELIRSRHKSLPSQIQQFRDNIHDIRPVVRRPERIDWKEDDHFGPQILRSPDPLPSHGHPDIERQNKIIADVYSPDYHQPTWILDYRYLKSGGRGYTRGPGGQILILPRNAKTDDNKDYPDFDSLLEHLRLSRLSEYSRHSGRGYGDDHDARRGYHYNDRHHQHADQGYYGHGHQQQNWWRANQHH